MNASVISQNVQDTSFQELSALLHKSYVGINRFVYILKNQQHAGYCCVENGTYCLLWCLWRKMNDIRFEDYENFGNFVSSDSCLGHESWSGSGRERCGKCASR
jgi:hypothetical protein